MTIISIDLDKGADPKLGFDFTEGRTQVPEEPEDVFEIFGQEAFGEVVARCKPIRRIIITGSRQWPNLDIPHMILDHLSKDSEDGAMLVHGACRGIDLDAAEYWGGMGKRVEDWPADWKSEGRRAGIIRNQMMVRSGADICIAFIYRESRGATHCAEQADKAGIPTVAFRLS